MAATATDIEPAFVTERFEPSGDRLEVAGHWVNLRGRHLVRPVLWLHDGAERRRIVAVLDHKPWAASDGEPWLAAFPWTAGAATFDRAELEVGRELVVELPVAGDRPVAVEEPRPARPRRPSEIDALRAELAEARAEAERARAEGERLVNAEYEQRRRALEAAESAGTRVREAEAATDLAQRQLAAARESYAALEAERDAASARADAAEAQRDGLATRAESAEAERDALATRVESAEAERDAATARAESASAERDAAIERAESASAERDAATARAESAEAERDAAIERADAAVPDEPASPAEDVAARIAALEVQRDAANARAAELVAQAAADADATVAFDREGVAERERLERQLAAAREERDRARGELTAADPAERERLRRRLAAAEEQRDHMRARLTAAEEERNALRNQVVVAQTTPAGLSRRPLADPVSPIGPPSSGPGLWAVRLVALAFVAVLLGAAIVALSSVL